MQTDERRGQLPLRRLIPVRIPAPGGRRSTIAAIAVAGLLQVFGAVALAADASPIPVPSPDHEPTDLVAAAHDGVRGYCYWGDLQGPPPAIHETRPRITSYTVHRGYAIPMYAADGVTRVGHFEIGGPGSAGGGASWDGSRREETADGHGTIIETKKSASGSITITRIELRGAVTTTTAANDPSLRRLPRAERPETWRAISLWFRSVGPKHPGLTSKRPSAPAWLVEKMSGTSRTAGDRDAVARWTLTFRRCAAPLEGLSTPGSDRGKYTVVWIAVLHGDFTDGDWIYLLLDRGSHGVISQGASSTPFDTSMFRLQGRTQLH